MRKRLVVAAAPLVVAGPLAKLALAEGQGEHHPGPVIRATMVHNVTEGLGIAAPLAEGGASASLGRLTALTLVAGAPAILGAWLGGFLTSDLLAVLFFALAAGAAFEVVLEVGRYVARKAPGGLRSGWVGGGFLAGVAIMYLTGLLIA